MSKHALIAGATGLVGGHCLQMLLEDPTYESVTSLVRRPTNEHAKLNEVVIDFDGLKEHASLFDVDHVYCCLGTTIKKAGSQEAFRRVDQQYPTEMAELSASKNVSAFSIVSSIGANSSSPFFYTRVKGEVEDLLAASDIRSVSSLQPSVLLGERSESRFGENVSKIFLKSLGGLLLGPAKKYRGIEAHQVAKAMIAITKKEVAGFRTYESDVLQTY